MSLIDILRENVMGIFTIFRYSLVVIPLFSFGTSFANIIRKPAVSVAVWPRIAASLSPISLNELIAKSIPASDDMRWDHLQIANVRWVTDGIDSTETGMQFRIGLTRVRASGVTSRLLRQKWEELTWTVELSTEGNSKWGPTTLNIRPGLTGNLYNGNYICFGSGFEGCSFPMDAIRGSKVAFIQRCTIGEGASQSVVFKATTLDGRRGTVVYQGSGGSGGFANGVEISTLAPQEYCNTFKDRGY